MKIVLLSFLIFLSFSSFSNTQSRCEETAADFWATSQEYKLNMSSKIDVVEARARHESCLESANDLEVIDCSILEADAWATEEEFKAGMNLSKKDVDDSQERYEACINSKKLTYGFVRLKDIK